MIAFEPTPASRQRLEPSGPSTHGISEGDQAILPIIVPPLLEQDVITEFLDYETKKTDALVAEQERLIGLLKEKRQAVISQAVTRGLKPDVSMKDSGVSWLGKVPSHWELKKVSHLFRAGKGKNGQQLTK